MHSEVQFVAGSGLRFSSNPKGNLRKKAPRCPLPEEPQKCELPNCFCSKYGRSPPGGLDPKDVPQFIVLTFDDAVNGRKNVCASRFLVEKMFVSLGFRGIEKFGEVFKKRDQREKYWA